MSWTKEYLSGLSVDVEHGCTENLSPSSSNVSLQRGSGFADVAVWVGSLEWQLRVEMGMETRGASLICRELAESTYSFFAWYMSDSKNRTSNPSSLPSAGWRCSCPKSSCCQTSSVSGTPSLLMISALIFFCSSVVPCWRKYRGSLPAILFPSFS